MKRRIDIHKLQKESIFKVPDTYFEGLPTEIQQKIALLNDFAVSDLPKELIFKVPHAYFQTLPENIQNKLEFLRMSETLASEQNPFEVPQHYFTDLSQKIAAQTTQKSGFSLDEIAEKVSVFQTPNAYFEWLPAKINARIAAEKEPKSIFDLEQYQYKWVYAGAFAVCLLILSLGYMNLFQTAKPNNEIVKNEQKEKPQKELFAEEKAPKIEQGEEENKPPVIIAQEKESQNELKSKALLAQNQVDTKITQPKIDYKLEKIEPNDLINYLSSVSVTEIVLIEMILEEDENPAESDDILMAMSLENEEDLYEQLSEEELEQLNQLLKKS